MVCPSYDLVWLSAKARWYKVFSHFSEYQVSRGGKMVRTSVQNVGAEFFALAARNYVSTVLWWDFVIFAGLSKQQEIRG